MPNVLSKDKFKITLSYEEIKQFCLAIGKCPKELRKICSCQFLRCHSVECDMLHKFADEYQIEQEYLNKNKKR